MSAERARPVRWRAVLRVLFGLGLLIGVVLWLDPRQIVASLTGLDRTALGLAILSQVLAKLIWTFRWRQILSAVGLARGYRDLLALVLIGLFFNSFLPTGFGGDLVRGYYVSRGREGMAASYLSVLMEKALGMITFAILAAGASILALLLGGTPLPRVLLISVAVAGGAIALGGTVLLTTSGWIAPFRRFPALGDAPERIAAALALLRRPGTPVLAIVISSFVLKLLAVVLYLFCARAVGIEVPAIVFFLVVPASVIAAMLPVTLNGLGIREGVMTGLLTAYGAPSAAAAAVAVLGLAVILGFALLGGLVYAFYRSPGLQSEAV